MSCFVRKQAGGEAGKDLCFLFHRQHHLPCPRKEMRQIKCNNYLSFLVHHLKMMPFFSQWWPLLYSACVGDIELSVSRSVVTIVRKERFVTLGNSVT